MGPDRVDSSYPAYDLSRGSWQAAFHRIVVRFARVLISREVFDDLGDYIANPLQPLFVDKAALGIGLGEP
jgi:hypothetical protein